MQKQPTQTALHLLTTGASEIEMLRFERNLTIKLCVLNGEKNIYSLCNNPESESMILKNIFQLTQRFLMVNFPESMIDATASQFSQDIVDLRRDWVLDDIIMFFKFIRQRQDLPELKTYGSKITSIKLIEFSQYYENERCEVKEQVLIYERNRELEINNFIADFGKELSEKISIAENVKREERAKEVRKVNEWHKQNEIKLKELKDKVKLGELEEMEMLRQYNNYLIR